MAVHRTTDADYWDMGEPELAHMTTFAERMGLRFTRLALGDPNDPNAGQVSILFMPPHVAGPEGLTTAEVFGSIAGVQMRFVGHPGNDVVDMFKAILDDPDEHVRATAQTILDGVPAE